MIKPRANPDGPALPRVRQAIEESTRVVEDIPERGFKGLVPRVYVRRQTKKSTPAG